MSAAKDGPVAADESASVPAGDPGAGAVPGEAWVAALASLSCIGPVRLGRLLDRYEPRAAFAAVARGSVSRELLAPKPKEGPLREILRDEAAQIDIAALWSRYQAAAVGVGLRGSPGYPAALSEEISPPPVLFWLGEPRVLDGPRVGIIGTRRCSRYGLDLAHEFGRDLAEAGVRVVSGLALGIDGAAHRGALSVDGAPPIGVVGSGLDHIYPKAHRELWFEVAERGLLCTEAPLGVAPAPWRFPARNRIIAALSDVLLVVESGVRGGSLLTVRDAYDRGRTVMAVPGPVRATTSIGTNRLLADGVAPALDVTDVLVALGLSPGAQRTHTETRPAPETRGDIILAELGWQPATLDMLIARTSLSVSEATAAIGKLTQQGWIIHNGGWIERVAAPDAERAG